jgi:hypothetical protein
MTLDQQLQLWNVIGTWFAGLATFSAVALSLWLANRSDSVNLKVVVGLRSFYSQGQEKSIPGIAFMVINKGTRAVTVQSIGWAVGKGKRKRNSFQMPGSLYSNTIPIELAHGRSATFFINFAETPDWMEDFAADMFSSNEKKDLATLRALVITTVGFVKVVTPESALLEALEVTLKNRNHK